MDSQQIRYFYEEYKERLRLPESYDEYNRIAEFFTRSYRESLPTEYGTSLMLSGRRSG